jgi:hypothetical protein
MCPCTIKNELSQGPQPGRTKITVIKDTSESMKAVIQRFKDLISFTEPQWSDAREPWEPHIRRLLGGRATVSSEEFWPRGSGPIYSPLAETLAKIAGRKVDRTDGVIFVTDGHQSTPGTAASLNSCSVSARNTLRDSIDKLTGSGIHLLLLVYDIDPCPPTKGVRSTLCRVGDSYCTEVLKNQQDSSEKWLKDEWLATLNRWVPAATTQAVLYKDLPDHAFDDAVVVGNDTGWRCSGVALDEHTVLTAAHCLPATRVRLGEGLDQYGATLEVESISRHPDPREDLALLHVTGKLTASVKLRRRADDAQAPAGMLRYVGFGITGQNGFGRKKLVDVPASGWGCDGTRVGTSGLRPGAELVMPGSAGRDTCSGDSGGPVYELVANGTTCLWRLIAITSRSVADGTALCGSGGIYTRVDAADEWITRESKRLSSTGREAVK